MTEPDGLPNSAHMTQSDFLISGPSNSSTMILLAHGAGAPMDSAAMTAVSQAIADSGFKVARFEFEYMAQRRRSGQVKPPPRAEQLLGEYRDAVERLNAGRLVIGGKSMGGRVASIVADELYRAGKIKGLLCLGYPFHPPGKPDQLRTAHLERLQTPTLIFQGTRDPFGTPDEVATYQLSKSIDILWLEDGDHDLKPRKKISGFSTQDHLRTLTQRLSAWSLQLR